MIGERASLACASWDAKSLSDILKRNLLFSLLLVVGEREELLIAALRLHVAEVSQRLSTNASSQVQIFLHHCDSVGMDGAEVSIFEKSCQVGFSCLLQGEECMRLEPESPVDTNRYRAHKPLEGGSRKEVVC